MIQIYHCAAVNEIALAALEEALDSFPTLLKARIKAYQISSDRHLRTVGYLMLREYLRGLEVGYSLADIKYPYAQKPSIRESNIEWSISHSGNQVIMAASNSLRHLGIDLEQIKPLDLWLYDELLSDGEKNKVAQSEDKLRTFYQIWTSKEAVIKAYGSGELDIAEVNTSLERIVYKGVNYTIQSIEVGTEYCATLAHSSSATKKIEMRKFPFKF